MARTVRSVSMTILAAGVLLATAGCPSPEGEPNPRPAATGQQGQQQQAPAAQQQQAPAAQQPAAQQQAQQPAAAPVQVSEAAMQEANQTFNTVCATCHGSEGTGEGPASAGFPVKPRSFKDAQWQQSVTDEHIARVIVQGGPAVGKSPLMPGNPQLADKPEVVAALVQKIRGFGQGGGAAQQQGGAQQGQPAQQ